MEKAVGIVVEYNPFHNGHKHHLEEAKKHGDIVIGVMSGDFVQRGEPAIINKWKRAEIALKEGVDILVELPCYYSAQSAEIFARGAVGILNELGIEKLIFGSESADVKKLTEVVQLDENEEFKQKLREELKKGLSYPTAYGMVLKEMMKEELQIESNDILGVEYLRAIRYFNKDIEPVAIKRQGGGYYSEVEENNILSASAIRKIIKGNSSQEDIYRFVPKDTREILREEIEQGKIANIEKLYPLIRYAIISQKDNLANIQDVEIGLDNRLFEMAMKYSNYSEFLDNLISKRYTIGRTQRVLIHVLLGITKEDTKYLKENVPYVKIYGFSNKGKKYLKTHMKDRESNVEILNTYRNVRKILSEKNLEFVQINERASTIYKMINNYEDKIIPLMED